MQNQIVYIVDDDSISRQYMQGIMESNCIESKCFADARGFLDSYDAEQTGCLVTDVCMPGMTGTELQEHLNEIGACLPIILVTAYADMPMAVAAMKNNAFDVIKKPFEPDDFIVCVRQALSRDTEIRLNDKGQTAMASKIDSLSNREKQVMDLVVLGFSNKNIARQLDLSEKTIECHRSNLMKKLGVKSMAELIRFGIVAAPETFLDVTTAGL